MTDEPTPWEEINPMVSAPRRGLQSPYSDRLTPASTDDFRNELTACLTLVAPVGMTEEAKRDWLAVAWATLGDLPPDLLKFGCRKARETCDHPSKIVPTILETTRESMNWRRDTIRDDSGLGRPQLPKPDYCTPEEAAEILREFGIKPKRVA
jgi:hypothetical protein